MFLFFQNVVIADTEISSDPHREHSGGENSNFNKLKILMKKILMKRILMKKIKKNMLKYIIYI